MESRPAGLGLFAAALTLALPAAYAASPATDAGSEAYARGAVIYERCAACHALQTDRTGPRHCGLIGRRAGSVPGFDYSPAMRKSGIVWTEANLDRFLRAPMEVVPGTAMGYDGIKDDAERHDLIVFLRLAGRSEQCSTTKAVPSLRY